MPRVKDLTGQIFGCREVLYRVKAPRGTNAWWRVRCIHCGREKDEMGSRLKLPGYQRCYCIPKGNEYTIKDNIVVMKDSKGKSFTFDLDDLEEVKKYTWQVYTTTNKKQYVRCSFLRKSLHRFLLNPPKEYVVDHINGDTLNNTRANLRVCSHTQNMRNQKLRKNNTSGVKGVYKIRDKYRATIRFNKKDIHLGMFETIEEAKQVRLEAEKKYFKEYRFKEEDNNERKKD